MAAKCSECGRDFGLRRQKHLCTVCGSAVCASKKCSSKDLLVYVPDKGDIGSQQSNEGNFDFKIYLKLIYLSDQCSG